MRAGLAAILTMLTWIAFVSIAASAQKEEKPEPLPPGLQVAKLLAGPDHKDFECDVELSPARLTFQLRSLVRLRAVVDPSEEDRRNKLDLYYVVKLADESGKWFPDQRHNHFPIDAGFDKQNAIEYRTGFYAKPGKYTAALIVYDAASGKTDVIRKPFEVKTPKDDPLPQLNRDLPAIEFAADIPTDQPPVRAQTRFFRTRSLAEFTAYHPEDAWPPAPGTQVLPVGNTRPLRVDMILNVSPPVDPYMERATPGSLYRLAAGMTLQAAAVLSQLRLNQGCVRVSAIDLSKLEVVFAPEDPARQDWSKLFQQLEDRNNNDTVSVKALTHRTETADFLADFIRKIAGDRSGCGVDEPTGHAVVFVSREFSFPSGTHDTRFDPQTESGIRYFQVRLKRYGNGDDLDHFFKPVMARRYDAGSPEQFRDAVAKLVTDLGGSGKNQK